MRDKGWIVFIVSLGMYGLISSSAVSAFVLTNYSTTFITPRVVMMIVNTLLIGAVLCQVIIFFLGIVCSIRYRSLRKKMIPYVLSVVSSGVLIGYIIFVWYVMSSGPIH